MSSMTAVWVDLPKWVREETHREQAPIVHMISMNQEIEWADMGVESSIGPVVRPQRFAS